MDGEGWETSSVSDNEVDFQYRDDEEHQYACGSVTKLQFRYK